MNISMYFFGLILYDLNIFSCKDLDYNHVMLINHQSPSVDFVVPVISIHEMRPSVQYLSLIHI